MWWLLVPILNTGNQACMKLLAGDMQAMPFGIAWLKEALQTPWAPAIWLCETVTFVLWMRILATVDVSRAVPLTASCYVLILLMGWFGFHEPVRLLESIGICFILCGVTLIGMASHSPKPGIIPV